MVSWLYIVADATRMRVYITCVFGRVLSRVYTCALRLFGGGGGGGHHQLTDVFLLEFTSQMAFDKSGLASTTVTNYALGQMSVNYEM